MKQSWAAVFVVVLKYLQAACTCTCDCKVLVLGQCSSTELLASFEGSSFIFFEIITLEKQYLTFLIIYYKYFPNDCFSLINVFK